MGRSMRQLIGPTPKTEWAGSGWMWRSDVETTSNCEKNIRASPNFLNTVIVSRWETENVLCRFLLFNNQKQNRQERREVIYL